MTNNVKPGNIIKSFHWPEPVEIKLIEEMGEYVHIVGATTLSREHIDQIIPLEEFSKILIESTYSPFSVEPWKVFLAIETIRYRFASMYDPLLSMNTSKVDPLPHQIEAVYGYVLKLPRIRFLIADDPGAGKTIMAGLIIKELKLRHIIKRILIVAPGHLKDQWRRELSDRFEEKFVRIDREILDALYGENVWMRENQIITSIDFAKREEVIPSITAAHFDLIIVDEAHKMSAYRYGDKTERTERYKLGEALSRISEHLLFLTATPHKGDPENFRLFLDLLEPGFFATNEMLQESIRNKDNPLFIRRVKEDLKDFEGKPLFLPRYIKTIAFNLGINSPKEKELYNILSEYVNTQYNLALTKDKRRNVAFALVILQRRLASSTFAVHESLIRRKKKLQDLLEGVIEKNKPRESTFDFDTVSDMSEEDRWKEEEVWETLSVAENREELEKEIRTIDGLIERARNIIQNEEEIKLKELKKSLQELAQKYPKKEDKKILIFTESRDTLEYLEKKIRDWGYTTNTIHGGMKLEDRIKAEAIFKNETQILVATEAAGEGINLQFCHLMLNYDIPWNPNRLEQRMGRIHRYGQHEEVYVFNLVAEDTREGMVVNKVFQKLEVIKGAMGDDKVFDVLSEVLYNKSLSQLLMEAAANSRKIDEILKDLDITIDEDYIAKVKENLGDNLATRYIDYTRIKEMAQKAREYRLIPEYTENFFKKAFVRAEGKTKERNDGFLSIESIPYEIRRITEQDNFRKSFGGLLKKYPKVTFDKEIAFKNPDAEFFSFGHPLFEAVMIWIENNFSDVLLNGATFSDPDGKMNGYILFYEGEIKDGKGEVAGKRLFGFYTDGKEIKTISPGIIWELAEEEKAEGSTVELEGLKKHTGNNVISKLEEYKKEILNERIRQTDIKQKYGIKSLEYLIVKLDGELISLYSRKESRENVDLAIRNKEERKDEYEKALIVLKDEIQKEKSLTMSMPRFVGIIRIIPSDKIEKAMQRDDEIERIGMEVAMEYERRNGRVPEDVCDENLGFDIRSTDTSGKIRYIEVKARAETGAVALTQPEWFKALRFKDDYYLHAVMNAGGKPRLYIIQNPSEKLEHQEKVEVVRFIVPFKEIIEKGDEATEK
ncbi:putative ATP-dependent RNA helicase [uncultured archaeon]|nr:putative ATP-dependent RNA helicase [uncultured archaeon]